MSYALMSYDLFVKTLDLSGLVWARVKCEPMKDHSLFAGGLYTAGVAFLSYVFLMSDQPAPDWRDWQIWLGKTSLLSALSFWLLAKFDGGAFFFILLPAGVLLVWF